MLDQENFWKVRAYILAANKQGAFRKLHAVFDREMDPATFLETLEGYLAANSLTPVAFFAPRKDRPGERAVVGLGLFWVRGRVWQIESLTWFPWVTPRNTLEAAIRFFLTMGQTADPETGRTISILEFAQEKDVPFFDHLCRYGIMRTCGTAHSVYPNQKARIYETRTVAWQAA